LKEYREKKEVFAMKKILLVLAIIMTLSIGLWASGPVRSHAQTKVEGWHTYEIKDLLYYTVRNPQGEHLGRMEDFVVDAQGRLIFAVITRPGILGIRGDAIAVPIEALGFGIEKGQLVLDVSWKKFAAAPPFDRKTVLDDRMWAEDVYRYFGVEPFWTD
jgi:hypothetical protein